MKANKLTFLFFIFILFILSNANALDLKKDIKYINIYSLSNHFILDNKSLNEKHPNLFIGLNAWNNKQNNGNSNINYGLGIMKNSFNNTSIYILSEYSYDTYKKGDFEIETGGKIYLTNGYNKKDMETKNINSEYVIDNDKLIIPGIFTRFIYKKIYIDTTLIPGVLTFNFGFKF